MKGKIELIGMEFMSCHGCLEIEQKITNRFVVDFSGIAEMGEAVDADKLEGTVDYSKVYDVVRREMDVPSKLLEHLAGRIVKAIATEIPEFESFSVCISKQRPPVDGVVAWSKVTLSYPFED